MKYLLYLLFLTISLSAFEFKSVEELASHKKVLVAPFSTCSSMLEKNDFKWTSGYKKSQRTTKKMNIFGATAIESIIHFENKKVSKIELIYFNKADVRNMTASKFSQITKSIGSNLKKKLKANPRKKLDDSKNSIYQWLKGSTKYTLEVIDKNEGKKSLEYIRLTVQSSRKARIKFYSHNELQARVKTSRSGDVYISKFPMVDQGEKGYCVCASLSRVLQHFGRDVDQHEVARMANSGKFGTSYKDIKTAFLSISNKAHVTQRKIGDFAMMPVMDLLARGQVDFDGDVNETYKRSILKEASKGRHSDGWEGIRSIVYNVMDKHKDNFRANERAIYNAIDLGRPIAWTLLVGFYEEKNIKEGQIGGHMRLIIGYNREKKEIIYTDTWGKGHEFKRVSVRDAMMATTAMWELRPKL